MVGHSGTLLLPLRVEDKFGTAGSTGLLSVESSDDKLAMIDSVLSCRVMGATQECMIALAVESGRRRNASLS